MKKQPNSDHCFVCGRRNPHGLYMTFYDNARDEVCSTYSVPDEYQSYPGIVHGGVIAAMLSFNLQAAAQNVWLLSFFSLVFVALSLSMFGFYEIQLPSSVQTRLASWSDSQEGGTLAGVFIMRCNLIRTVRVPQQTLQAAPAASA